ncbi:hypothetical protein QQ045_012932 [Rhodiola kirilowii]
MQEKVREYLRQQNGDASEECGCVLDDPGQLPLAAELDIIAQVVGQKHGTYISRTGNSFKRPPLPRGGARNSELKDQLQKRKEVFFEMKEAFENRIRVLEELVQPTAFTIKLIHRYAPEFPFYIANLSDQEIVERLSFQSRTHEQRAALFGSTGNKNDTFLDLQAIRPLAQFEAPKSIFLVKEVLSHGFSARTTRSLDIIVIDKSNRHFLTASLVRMNRFLVIGILFVFQIYVLKIHAHTVLNMFMVLTLLEF